MKIKDLYIIILILLMCLGCCWSKFNNYLYDKFILNTLDNKIENQIQLTDFVSDFVYNQQNFTIVNNLNIKIQEIIQLDKKNKINLYFNEDKLSLIREYDFQTNNLVKEIIFHFNNAFTFSIIYFDPVNKNPIEFLFCHQLDYSNDNPSFAFVRHSYVLFPELFLCKCNISPYNNNNSIVLFNFDSEQRLRFRILLLPNSRNFNYMYEYDSYGHAIKLFWFNWKNNIIRTVDIPIHNN